MRAGVEREEVLSDSRGEDRKQDVSRSDEDEWMHENTKNRKMRNTVLW